jgi:GT2 family glycosyltransferase
VRIVVVNFNAGALLARCMDALSRQSFGEFEAVVVDNASSDGSAESVPLADARFRLMRLSRNVGFAEGCNRGAEGFEGRWYVFLNPDAFPESDWLERLLAASRRHPGVAMFGSTQVQDGCRNILDGAGDCYLIFGFPWRGGWGYPLSELPAEGEVFGPCAAAAMYDAKCYRALGGMDSRFFCYLEDVDLAYRMRLAGHRCMQIPDAVVYHVGSAITGRTSDFTMYHSSRNLIWTYFRNMPIPLLLAFLPGFVFLMALRLAFSVRAPFAMSMWKGIVSGLRGVPDVWGTRRRGSPWSDTRRVAPSLTWSIGRFIRGAPDVRPIAGLMQRTK